MHTTALYLKKFLFAFLSSLLISGVSSFQIFASPKIIALTQITSHDSLDKVRQGILEQLNMAGYIEGETATFYIENAQGNITVAAQIAKKSASLKPDIMIAIATPSAQALMPVSENDHIPLVFASISDPVGAKLVKNLRQIDGLVTGTCNIPPLNDQARALKSLFPNLKKVGIILNYSETNSVAMLEKTKEALKLYGIEVETTSVTHTTQVKAATEALITRVEALVLLQDNMVASAAPVVLETALQHKIPTLAGFEEALPYGALLTLSYDEFEIGKQTGAMAVKILNGEDMHSLPVEMPKVVKCFLNTSTAYALEIPEDVLKRLKILFPKMEFKE